MFSRSRAWLLPTLFASCVAAFAALAAPPRVALATMLDGDAVVLRDGSRLALAEGVGLQAGDLLVTGARTQLLRLEFADGRGVAVGPDSKVWLAPHDAGPTPPGTAIYLLAGEAKLVTPAGVPAGVQSPALDVASTGGAAVLVLSPAGAQVFAETGPLQVQPHAARAGARTLKAGEMLALQAADGKPVLSERPTPAFIAAMPRAFMDSLPARAAAFQGKDVAAKPLGPLRYADAQPWIDAEPALRRVFVKRWRALARDGEFRRGLVDGLKSHPEWQPVLFPPEPVSPHAASGGAHKH